MCGLYELYIYVGYTYIYVSMYVYIYGLYYMDYMNYKPLTNDAHGMNPMIFLTIQMSTECYIPLSSDLPSTIDGI